MPEFTFIVPLIVGVMILFVFGLIVFMVVAGLRRQKARETFLAAQGFSKLPSAPGLLQRLDAIFRRGPVQRFRLSLVFEKQSVQGSCYVFNLTETSGEDNQQVADGGVAWISPDLHLPRFMVTGRLHVEGKAAVWMAGAAEKLINWAAERGGFTSLHLDDMPEIDERLLVLVQEPDAAREFFTRERLGRLLWLAEKDHSGSLDGGGDCFVLKRATLAAGKDAEIELRSRVDDARRAYTALS